MFWHNAIGSVRVAFTPTANGNTVVQENTYYPFGAVINELSYYNASLSTNRYKREGKEYISDFSWNKYDYTARTFDPWNGQALQLDPLAEKYYSTSPYALWNNNPIKYIDPDGRYPFDPWMVPLWLKIKSWAEEQMGAVKRLVTGTSGEIDAPADAGIPEHTKRWV